MNLHRILSQIALVAGGFLFSLGLQTFAAGTWSEPTVLPPNANAEAPLHTGSDAQAKSGGLLLNTGGATNGLIIQNGNVGIGTVSPQAMLDVRGEVIGLSPDAGTTGGVSVRAPASNNPSYLQFVNNAATAEWAHISATSAGNLILQPAGNGNVGIGTANPQYRFAVGNQNNPFQVSDSGDVIVNGGTDGNWALYYPDASRGVLTINSGGIGVHADLQVDGNATINGTIRGATYGFGGMYSIHYDTWCGESPSQVNPFTGSCSCPSGFTSYLVSGGSSNVDPRIYMCAK